MDENRNISEITVGWFRYFFETIEVASITENLAQLRLTLDLKSIRSGITEDGKPEFNEIAAVVIGEDVLNLRIVDAVDEDHHFHVDQGLDIITWLNERNEALSSEFRAELAIDKPDKGSLTIYALENFAVGMTRYNLSSLISRLGNAEEAGFEFILFENEHLNFVSRSGYFRIRGFGVNQQVLGFSDLRKETLSYFRSNCHFESESRLQILPDDFDYPNSTATIEELVKVLDKLKNALSVIFVADFSSIFEDRSLKYKINGYRSSDWTVEVDKIGGSNLSVFYEIYKWVYARGEVDDKIGLARNIISIHQNDALGEGLNERTIASIKSSYKIYLKANFASYIQVHNKVTEELISQAKSVDKIVDEFAQSFRRSIFGILTFYASVILIRLINKSGIDGLFTPQVTIVSLVILVIGLLYQLLSNFEMSSQIKRYESSFNLLEQRFGMILDEEEIKETLNDGGQLKENIDHLKSKRRLYNYSWIAILTLLAILSVVLCGINILAMFLSASLAQLCYW